MLPIFMILVNTLEVLGERELKNTLMKSASGKHGLCSEDVSTRFYSAFVLSVFLFVVP